jgi:hypothetical protein
MRMRMRLQQLDERIQSACGRDFLTLVKFWSVQMPIQIGVLHSTAFTSPMHDSFVDGLQAAGHWPDGSFGFLSPKNEEGNYGRDVGGQPINALYTDAVALANSGCNLIVAGGLVAVDAANKVARTPTIGLIGRTPRNPQDPGYDATHKSAVVKYIVDLDASSHDPERARRLEQPPFNVPANGIALMVNINSEMGENEAEEWEASGGTALRFPDLGGNKNNDAVHFDAFFRSVSNLISGIVVSSDPFFFRVRTRLIKSANAARPAGGANPQFKFCFPFAEWQFKDSGIALADWDPNRHIGYCGTGKDLQPAYKQLGAAADELLSALYSPPIVFTASNSRWQRS